MELRNLQNHFFDHPTLLMLRLHNRDINSQARGQTPLLSPARNYCILSETTRIQAILQRYARSLHSFEQTSFFAPDNGVNRSIPNAISQSQRHCKSSFEKPQVVREDPLFSVLPHCSEMAKTSVESHRSDQTSQTASLYGQGTVHLM